MIQNIEIRRVDRNTFDIFQGTQWGTWTRVRTNRHSTYRVSGEQLGHPELKALHEVLHPNMPINYNQTPAETLRNCQNLQ